jgi:hypothetical protein
MRKRVGTKRRGVVITAALAALGLAFALVGTAGADLSNGGVVPGAATVVGTVTTGTPLSSGQKINVVVPPNSLFNHKTAVNVFECSAPDGVAPTTSASCDGNTIQGASVLPNADGSVDLKQATGSLYPVYALPDGNLGESSTGTACGITASTECMLYIGENVGDFAKPHVWSQPFFVAANAGDLGDNPGDGSAPTTPSVASGSLSTAVASPTTAAADGKDASTITVTLLGAGNVPVPGRTVVLG